ncbi:MAG: dihydrofolate reductase [Ignavibacteriales bacterium]|nr:MAG: dihydrofolate reductase [Ignavibacteriales bacterium]
MRKIIFSINITLDGFADHEAVIADDELHDFYADLLNDIDLVIFGRKTYQLLESFWPTAAWNPNSTKGMINFADKINSVPKMVFTKTLTQVNWTNTIINRAGLVDEVLKLKNQPGKNISIGGLSIASVLAEAGLTDEYYFVTQPIILGEGKRIFSSLNERINLKLLETRVFQSGVVVLHYSI